jgi:hypothetical protein
MKFSAFRFDGYLRALVFAAFTAQGLQGQLTTQQKDDIGFTALQTKLGAGMPTGTGISVSQVEAQDGSANYRPDATVLTGKNFIYASVGSTAASSHATTVGKYFYGSSSLAPSIGVSPQRVTSYDANGFIGSNFLRTSNTTQLPVVESNDIQNHSWVGELGTTALNIDATRRMDYAIQRDDFVAVFGLNNGSGTAVPSLMAGSYNGITVGLSNGAHSRGGTTLDSGSRTRPDIVVPTTATSWAAPTVGGAVALLLETSRGTLALSDASKSIVVKSLLMTGASRVETEFTTPWAHTASQPLDAVYGAGELNVLNSHDILKAGQNDASGVSTVTSTGWDFGIGSSVTTGLYFFDLISPGSAYDIAASLVWNREITALDTQPGSGVNYTFTPKLVNLDLRLFSATGFVLGSELVASTSTVDNVELIVAKGLAAGRYAWQVTSADPANTEYGFSWNVESVTMAVPEPSTLILAALGILLPLVRRR